jgi:stage V sporulation protein D (sporulation-specific penicillin-binding protein)
VEHFGLTEKTMIALPAEAYPLLIPRDTLNNVEAATMSFGHGIAITPIQLMQAIGAIANNGLMMQPYIVDSIIDSDGNVIDQFEPRTIRQVISEKTSVEMRLMMESVVDNGSGANAQISGIRIGGKTGTSEKIVDGVYNGDYVYASFTGIAPVENPQIAVLIVIDEPQFSTYGSVVAAPVARDVMVDTFRYLGINPVQEEEDRVIEVPDFTGMNIEQAQKAAQTHGISISMTDEIEGGIVTEQYPKSGKMVRDGALVILKIDEGAEDATQ